MKVIKVDPSWNPVEYPGLQVGDAVEIDNAEVLLKLGQVKAYVAPKKAIKVKKEAPVKDED